MGKLSESHPRIVALWAVSEFEYVGEQPSLAEARAFAAGASEGGSYFGDGVSSFVLPEDLRSIDEWLTDEYVERTAAEEWDRVKAGLPPWALERTTDTSGPTGPGGNT